MIFYPITSIETPLSLQSICRLTVRKALGIHHLDNVDKLGLVPPYDDFMAFRELFISAGQNIFETHMLTISKVSGETECQTTFICHSKSKQL